MNKNHKAELLLVCATVLAGFGWVFAKQTIQGMPPFLFIATRFIIASFILMPLCIPMLTQLSEKDMPKSALVGLLQGVALLIWIYSVSISDTLGEGAFITSLSMLFVPLIAWPLFRQKPGRSFWIALPIAVMGLYMLSRNGEWQASSSQFFFLLAAITLAFQFNLNSRFAKSIPVLPLTCIQFLFTGLLAIPVSLVAEVWPDSISTTTWLWLIASILPATCLRFLVQIAGQKSTTATNAAIIMILEPLWTMLLSILIYAEALTFNKVIGCLLILTALLTYRLWDLVKVYLPERS